MLQATKTTTRNSQKALRYTLGTLLAFVALNAFGGGYYGLSGAKNVPVQWLINSPFANYFIPSLILFVVVGGTCVISAVAVFRNRDWGKKAAILSFVILAGWLSTQMLIIGYVSWMQPATAMAAIIVLLLALMLHTKQLNPA